MSLPAQIVLWGWGLLTIIILSMYGGATAAILTTQQLTGTVKSKGDLLGKAVGTWTGYVDKLAKEDIPTIGMRW